MTDLAPDIVEEKRVIADLRTEYKWRKSGAPLYQILRQVPGAVFRFVLMALLCGSLYALDHHTLRWAQGSGLFPMLRACLVVVAGVVLCHFVSWRLWEATGPGFRAFYKRAYFGFWRHALILFGMGVAVSLVTSLFKTSVPPPMAIAPTEIVTNEQIPVAAPELPVARSWVVAGASTPLLLTHAEASVQCSVVGRLPVREDLNRVRSELWGDRVMGEFWMAEQRDGKFLVLKVGQNRVSTEWYRPREGGAKERQALCIVADINS